MKTTLLKRSMLVAALAVCGFQANSQVKFQETFGGTTLNQFVTPHGFDENWNPSTGAFQLSQEGGVLKIEVDGHGEWDNAKISINNGTASTTISMTTDDVIYVRARAIPSGSTDEAVTDVAMLGITVGDNAGTGVNNNDFNAINKFILTNEFETYEVSVPNFAGNEGATVNNENIDFVELTINVGFATYPVEFEEEELIIDQPFSGTVEVDFVSIGDLPTSRKAKFASNLFEIYPNPSSDVVYFNFNEALTANTTPEIMVYDNVGNLVFSGTHSSGVLQGLDKGMYMVQVKAGDVMGQRKLVIF